MRGLSLFSGIGGLDLAAEWVGIRTVAFCEIDSYCQKVLKKHWPDVPIHENVFNLRGDQVGQVDIIYGGFPRQPFSVAGKQKGKADKRHLWPEVARLVGEIKPRWCFLRTYLEFSNSQQTMFAPTWSVLVTTSGFGIMKLRLSARTTEEQESHLWLTPDAHCDRGASSVERMEKKISEGMPIGLNDRVAHPLMFPTPRQFMYKDSETDRGKGNLGEVVGGQLNPDWVEWMMGFPTGWTESGGE